MSSLCRKRYSPLHGADFTSDPALADYDRAPICENISPDLSGFPEKRLGWRRLKSFDAKIYGLHSYTSGGEEKLIVHTGNKLMLGDETLCETMAENISRSFQDGDKLIILDGEGYTVYDGETVKRISSDNDTLTDLTSGAQYTDSGAYIPTTSIASYAMESYTAYTFSNGTAYESVNKLTSWRRMTSVGPDNDASGLHILPLDCSPIRTRGELYYSSSSYDFKLYTLPSVRVFINGEEKTVLINRYDSSSYSSAVFSSAAVKDCIFFLYKGTKDSGAPILPKADNCWLAFFPSEIKPAPDVEGRDNIEIYCKVEANESGDIIKCRTLAEYNNSVFVTGNADKPNYDWHSEHDNPFYFPDVSYRRFGDATELMGYLPSGSSQAVVKKSGAVGGSIYIRSVSGSQFSVEQIKSGVGALSHDGFCSFMGDDLMLTDEGIVAIVSQDVSGVKTLKGRSLYIDKRLLAEPKLSSAVMIVHDGKCICFTGGNAYVLNGRSSRTGGQYDCYFWSGIPVDRAVSSGGTIYFSDGADLCRFSDDLEAPQRYCDDGAAIRARFGTRFDDDGDPTRYKTMIKHGCSVTVKPFVRSGAKVYLRTESRSEKCVKSSTADIFSWENIDFSRLSFDATDDLREIYVGTKVKRYKRLQFIVENDSIGENFCVIGIDKHYATGNFIKR